MGDDCGGEGDKGGEGRKRSVEGVRVEIWGRVMGKEKDGGGGRGRRMVEEGRKGEEGDKKVEGETPSGGGKRGGKRERGGGGRRGGER